MDTISIHNCYSDGAVDIVDIDKCRYSFCKLYRGHVVWTLFCSVALLRQYAPVSIAWKCQWKLVHSLGKKINSNIPSNAYFSGDKKVFQVDFSTPPPFSLSISCFE